MSRKRWRRAISTFTTGAAGVIASLGLVSLSAIGAQPVRAAVVAGPAPCSYSTTPAPKVINVRDIRNSDPRAGRQSADIAGPPPSPGPPDGAPIDVAPSETMSKPTVLTTMQVASEPLDNSFATQVPPDAQLAAGDRYLVEMTNNSGSIWEKTANGGFGLYRRLFDIAAFFDTPAGFTFADPRVFYDRASGRFFAAGFYMQSGPTLRTTQQELAVSQTSDPYGKWWLYQIGQRVNILEDHQEIGFSDDKVVSSWINFAFEAPAGGGALTLTPKGQETWILQKADLVSGLGASAARFCQDPDRSSIVPVPSLSPTNTEYMTYARGAPNAFGVVAISGAPKNRNVVWSESDLPMTGMTEPAPAGQPGGGVLRLDTDSARFISAVWRDGILWAAGGTRCATGACLRLVQYSTQTGNILQSFDDGRSGASLIDPAVTTDANGSMFVVYTAVSPGANENPSVEIDGQPLGSPDNSLAGPTVVGPGSATYGGGCNASNVCRWGDYSSAAVDPVNPYHVWMTGELAATGNLWATQTTELVFVPTISLTPPAAHEGDPVTIKGRLFKPGEDVVVTAENALGSQQLKTALADGSGSFAVAVNAPAKPGFFGIRARGQTSGLLARAPFSSTGVAEWAQGGSDSGHTYAQPAEATLSAANLGLLRWVGSNPGRAEPIVANGTIYQSGAFPETGCPSTGCLALWTTAHQGTPVAVSHGLFLQMNAQNQIEAYSAAGCGHAVCHPTWAGEESITPPVVAHGMVYAFSGFPAHLVGYHVDGCGAQDCPIAFDATPRHGSDPREGWMFNGDLVVGDNMVFASQTLGIHGSRPGYDLLYGLPLDGCRCMVDDKFVVSLAFGGAIAAANGYVYTVGFGIYAAKQGLCPANPDTTCLPQKVADVNARVAFDNGTMFTSTGAAYPSKPCGGNGCTPIWRANVNPDVQPIVANGLVYMAPYVFPEVCASPCKPISTTAPRGVIADGMIVGDQGVYGLAAPIKAQKVEGIQPVEQFPRYFGLLATFTDDTITGSPRLDSARVDWGDGTVEDGIIRDDGAGGFTVYSLPYSFHAYADEGNATITISITANRFAEHSVAQVQSPAAIDDATLDTFVPPRRILPAVGKEFSGALATFFDESFDGTPLRASIDWGDGTITAGDVVTTPDGTDEVDGSHVYEHLGEVGAVTVTDPGGSEIVIDFHVGPELVVNTTADTADAKPGDAICADAQGKCSLFASIQEASALGGGTITFDIPGGGPQVITPKPGELQLGAGIVIDATTQHDYAGQPLIGVVLPAPSAGSVGLALSGEDTVRGLAIQGFAQNLAIGGSGNTLEADWIGLDPAGAAAANGDGVGVAITGSNNRVGGADAGNVISGNRGDGVLISGQTASGNLVLGNVIGLAPDGTKSLGNAGNGVHLIGAPGSRIGDSGPGEGNEIGGNHAYGIDVEGVKAVGTRIRGNTIGSNTANEVHLGNTKGGVLVTQGASDTLIGGARDITQSSCESRCNLISGNLGDGVLIAGGASLTAVSGNFVGTTSDGTAGLANSAGIAIDNSASNLIGGHQLGEGNLVSGNLGEGVHIGGAAASGNVLEGNLIGPPLDGTDELAASNAVGVVVDGAAGAKIGTAAAGNLISSNRGDGIQVSGPATDGTLIQGNSIGTYIGGGGPLANGGNGVTLASAPGVTIGGLAKAEGNTISGNTRNGISVSGAATTDLKILGNLVGVYTGDQPSGTYEGNGLRGIEINGAPRVVIGLPGAGNVASGNGGKSTGAGGLASTGGEGIWIGNSGDPQVQANLVGTDAGGTKAVPNRGDGIRLESVTDPFIGGSGAGQGNVLSGNGPGRATTYAGSGLLVKDGTNLQVYGNRMGTNAAGTATIPNTGFGLASIGVENAFIGAAGGAKCDGGCNLVSGNNQGGIVIAKDAIGNQTTGGDLHYIRGNFIGADINGQPRLGNAGKGIFIAGAYNHVGGTNPGQGNLVVANSGGGVAVGNWGSAGQIAPFIGNQIEGNRIFGNAGLGIDLGDTGTVLANDPSNPAVGANLHQHFPVLTSATTGSDRTVTLKGTLKAVFGTKYVIDIYANDACDPSDFGEGQDPLTQIFGETDVNGLMEFEKNLGVVGGNYVTATATDNAGNTSEFSRCVKVDGGSITAAPDAPMAGQPVMVTGDGLAPNSTADVTVHSAPVQVATLTADAHGRFGAIITMPTDLGQGPHVITLKGAAPDHSARMLSADLWIVPGQFVAPSPPAQLPPTGAARTLVLATRWMFLFGWLGLPALLLVELAVTRRLRRPDNQLRRR